MARTKEFDEQEMLDKALQVFKVKGYNGTSTQDLVDNLCLSRSSIYNCYEDKHNLFIQVMRRYRETVTEGMITRLKTALPFKTIVQQIFDDIIASDDSGCFLATCSLEAGSEKPQVAELVRENMEAVEKALADAVKRAQKTGEISAEWAPKKLAGYLYNNLNGIMLMLSFGADKKACRDIASICLSVVDRPGL